ncbi:MAG: amidohydrolase [Gemmatimonadetes bacterium]|nr:amidohydrolase [Gemmatimonadota bacterium]
MPFHRSALFVAAFALIPLPGEPGANPKLKAAAVAEVENQAGDLIRLADSVWHFAETALRETRSAALLASHAEREGFRVVRGVAGMPTAFTAEFGTGSPVIGIMGEYDALPGLSQKTTTSKDARVAGAAGHGCGHNLFGAASLGGAVAIKRMIERGQLKGTIRFYGTPAEESVGGKVYMVREGAFKDVDVMLAWHPADRTQADNGSTQAIVDFVVEFRGKTAHAAADPWNARSAADAVEAFTHGVNLLREHVRPSVRMHYTVQRAGDVPNVVPDYGRVWMWARDSKSAQLGAVLTRIREIADGAAKIAGVEGKLTVQAGDYEILVNHEGSRLLDRNLKLLGPISYTEEEQSFAKAIQRAVGVAERGMVGEPQPLKVPAPAEPEGGSTDVGDVSWVVPTLHFSVATGVWESPWHAWPVVATGGMSIGHKGMLHAAKVMAVTAADLFVDPALRGAIRAEFTEQTKGFEYRPWIPAGPPPVPTTP